jgi:hypothetical protein
MGAVQRRWSAVGPLTAKEVNHAKDALALSEVGARIVAKRGWFIAGNA